MSGPGIQACCDPHAHGNSDTRLEKIQYDKGTPATVASGERVHPWFDGRGQYPSQQRTSDRSSRATDAKDQSPCNSSNGGGRLCGFIHRDCRRRFGFRRAIENCNLSIVVAVIQVLVRFEMKKRIHKPMVNKINTAATNKNAVVSAWPVGPVGVSWCIQPLMIVTAGPSKRMVTEISEISLPIVQHFSSQYPKRKLIENGGKRDEIGDCISISVGILCTEFAIRHPRLEQVIS